MIESHLDSVNLTDILTTHIFNRDKLSLCPQLIHLFLKLLSASLSLLPPSALYPLTLTLLTFAYDLLAPAPTATAPLPDLDLALLQDTIPVLLAAYQALPAANDT